MEPAFDQTTERIDSKPMRIDILTLFPEMCDTVLRESIIGRARERGLVELNCRNIRDYTLDKHNRVDDTPYGGGMGMVMQTQPIYDCFQALCGEVGRKPHFIYLSPQGKVLTQNRVRELAEYENLALLCGHYEGVDERVIEELVDEEISIGDYVLTGGELPALVLVDAVCRMLPGVLANDEAFQEESHFHSLLEYPQYTRPYEWHGEAVPDVLLSGHHANIMRWRRERALERTFYRRPALFGKGGGGGASKPNAFEQVFADVDLMADGAVHASTFMVGFRCDIGNRGQHNKGQHYGQQARHKTKFLCHGLSSFPIVIFPCSPNKFHRGSCQSCPI